MIATKSQIKPNSCFKKIRNSNTSSSRAIQQRQPTLLSFHFPPGKTTFHLFMTRVPISCPNTTTTTTASTTTTTTTTILTCTQEQTEQSSQLQTKHKSDNNNNNKHSNNNHKKMKNHIDHNNNNNNNNKNNNNNIKSNHHHHYNNRHYYKMSPLFRALVMIFCLLVALFQSYAPMRYKILCSIVHMIYFFIDDNIVSIVLFLVTRKTLLDDNRTSNHTKQSNVEEEEEDNQNKSSKNAFSSRSGNMTMNNHHVHHQKQSEKQQQMNETVWKLYCLPPNCQINMLHIHLIRSLYLALLPLYSYAFLGIEAPVWLTSFVFQQSLAVNLSTVTDAHWSLILIVVSSHFVATVVGMFCIAPRFAGPSYSLCNVISPIACLICSMVMMIRICEFMKQIATREREDEKHATFVHSEIMYRKMYRDAPCLFITVNRAGVILNCNTAVQKLTCRSEDALIGSVFYSLLTPESQAALRNVLVICGTTNTKKDVVINNIELEMKGGYVNMTVDSDRSLLGSGGSGDDDEEETTASSTSGSSSLGHSDERRNKNKCDDKTLTRDNYMIHHMLASITKTYQRSINSMDNNGPMELVYNIVLQDMSENNMTQHQLKVAKEQAEEANRTKSMFLNSMSHELRTPLTAIVGLSEILLMDKRLIDEQLDVVKSISRSSVVLRTLISDILDLSKIEAGRCQLEHYRFDLKSALETVDRLTRTSALEKQLEYKFEVADNVPTRLMGDAMRLNQVLLNLCNNCIKFTHKGSVTVSVTSDHNSLSPYMQSQLPKHHSNNPNQTQLFFSVSDTGIGIPARKMRELFQPFTQVQAFETRFTGGTGLGLYISKSLVQLMKGHIAVASKEGFGSTFTFSMVLGIDNAQLDETIVESPSELLGPCLDCPSDNLPRDLRVLVTDDNLINQRVLSKTLQSLGVPLDNIQFASDGRSAVDTYHNSSGNIDLIFMDLHMPIMNGFEATQTIRKVDSKTIIVCLTANATDQAKQKCESAGFSHYLSKPYTRTQIADILNRVKTPVV